MIDETHENLFQDRGFWACDLPLMNHACQRLDMSVQWGKERVSARMVCPVSFVCRKMSALAAHILLPQQFCDRLFISHCPKQRPSRKITAGSLQSNELL